MKKPPVKGPRALVRILLKTTTGNITKTKYYAARLITSLAACLMTVATAIGFDM